MKLMFHLSGLWTVNALLLSTRAPDTPRPSPSPTCPTATAAPSSTASSWPTRIPTRARASATAATARSSRATTTAITTKILRIAFRLTCGADRASRCTRPTTAAASWCTASSAAAMGAPCSSTRRVHTCLAYTHLTTYSSYVLLLYKVQTRVLGVPARGGARYYHPRVWLHEGARRQSAHANELVRGRSAASRKTLATSSMSFMGRWITMFGDRSSRRESSSACSESHGCRRLKVGSIRVFLFIFFLLTCHCARLPTLSAGVFHERED
jgi:hypothetical protein